MRARIDAAAITLMLAALALTVRCAAAQTVRCPAPARDIRVLDRNGDNPVEGATLVLFATPACNGEPMGQRRLAGAEGCVDAGRAQWLRVQRMGYAPALVSLAQGGPIVVRLEPAPVELAAVRNTAERVPLTPAVESQFGGAAVALTPQLRGVVPCISGPDVLRSITLVAPAAALSELSAGIGVYGSDPHQTRLDLEGVPVLGAQHLGGVFSALPSGAIGAATPLPATARASLGEALGGRVQLSLRRDSTPGTHGDIETGMVASAATVRAGGWGDGANGRWNLLASARVSTIDRLAAAVRPDGFPYSFDDLLASATATLPTGARIVALAVRTRDQLRLAGDGAATSGVFTEDTTEIGLPDADWSRESVGGHVEQPLGPVAIRAALAQASTQGTATAGFGKLGVANRLDLSTASLTIAATRLPIAGVRAEFGVSRARASNRYTIEIFDAPATPSAARLTATSAWAEARALLGTTIEARAGARFESVPDAAWQSVLPGVGITWRHPDRALRMDVTMGGTAQWLHSATPDGALASPVEFFILSGRNLRVSTGGEIVAALAVGSDSGAGGGAAHVTAWVRRASNVPDRPPALAPFGAANAMRPASAAGQGLDVRLLTRRASGLFAVLGYTLASSTRSLDGRTWPTLADRRHTVTALAAMPAGTRTTLSMAWLWHTGVPTTDQTGVFYQRLRDPLTGQWDHGALMEIRTSYGSLRLPDYARLDVQVSRTLVDEPWARVQLTAGVINVLDRLNPLQYEWAFVTPPAHRELRGQLPILPSLGLTASF